MVNRGEVQLFMTTETLILAQKCKCQISVMVLPVGVVMIDGTNRIMVRRFKCGRQRVITASALMEHCLN